MTANGGTITVIAVLYCHFDHIKSFAYVKSVFDILNSAKLAYNEYND